MAGQRAFVIYTPYWRPDKDPTLGQPLNFNFGVRWTNTGHLATREMRNYINFKFTDDELLKESDFSDSFPAIAAGTMLGPEQSVEGPPIPANGNVSSADISAIQSGSKKLFIFGWVKYFDGFPNTQERTTKFCFKVSVTGNPNIPFTFIPCDIHNSAT